MRREWIEILYKSKEWVLTRSPSMRREWIEILERLKYTNTSPRLPPCGGSGLKWVAFVCLPCVRISPSMRREWIEISANAVNLMRLKVSLHAEGVD